MNVKTKLSGWLSNINAVYATLVLLVAILAMILWASCSHAATLDGGFTYPTKYVDGSTLPISSIKHVRVEVGTCSSPNVFGTKEAETLVVPPTLTWAATTARVFGDFCARAYTVTTLNTESDATGNLTINKPEPKPNPPGNFVINRVVWEIKSHPVEGTMLARQVGTVPLGTGCADDPLVYTMNGEYHEVPTSDVSFTVRNPKGTVFVALCAPPSG